MRRAADGWHAVLRIGAVDHRVWSKDPPVLGASYAAELPFDGDFGARAYAARRLWRAMNGRAPGPAFHQLSKQRRERLSEEGGGQDAPDPLTLAEKAEAIALSPKRSSAKSESPTVPGRPMICAIEQSAWCKAALR